MARENPTIIVGHLNDAELKKSIDALVAHVEQGTKKMVDNFNTSIDAMKRKLNELGSVKVDMGGSADGGSTRRTTKQKEETEAIKETTRAYKVQKTTLDEMARAQQVAIRTANPNGIRNADTLQTMNIQLDLLVQKLRDARSQYSAYVAMARDASTTGDKGYFQMATAGVHKYEEIVHSTINQIRALRASISQMGDVIAPQGHAIQNYVNSLQKANPELAALNERFKQGRSEMQKQTATAAEAVQATKQYTSEIENQKQQARAAAAKEQEYSQTSIERERQRREEIKRTGEAARQTSKEIINSMHQQASVPSSAPIKGIKELTQAVVEMRRAYFDLSPAERESAVGQALRADIEKAQKAITIVREYNSSVFKRREGFEIGNESTLKSLRENLKKLTEQYERLTVAQINAGKGDHIVERFQATTRAAHIMQRTLNTPINLKAALAGDERTLDDIAYKMQRLRSYKLSIDLTNKNAANEIRQVDEALSRLQREADKWMRTQNNMIAQNEALARSWNYMKNRLAFYFTVGATTSFIKQLIEVRGQYELLERSIGILIDSAQNGTRIFAELNAMAIKSPFTTMELGAAAKQLVAYDVAAKDVVDTTKRLADMAAAVGIPIERLTYALGQIKAYGYLNARDARMFSNAGIPLVKELSDYYTQLEGRLVSVSDVYDRIKKKAIGYNEVMEVVNKMTDEGGKFFNFQEKAADTLKVRLANLTLAWNNMLNEIGKDSQGIITSGLAALKWLFERWREFGNILYGVVVAFGLVRAAQLVAVRTGLVQVNTALASNMKMWGALGNTAKSVLKSLVSVFSNPWNWAMAGAAAIMYLSFSYKDLLRANEALNKSIADSADENINSIDKFFDEYHKQLDTIDNASASDKSKMWERMQEEIEKTNKNAKQYVSILEEIEDLGNRINVGKRVLEQTQEIEKEAKRIAERGLFNMGGGYADDSLAQDLIDYADHLNVIQNKYGSLAKANEDYSLGAKQLLSGFRRDTEEAYSELERFTGILDKADISRIMGDDPSTQLANIREFASIVRDNFLATEKGQKITAEGQALLNDALDKWVAKQGVANKVITNSNIAAVEGSRSAWETFFDQLNKKDRERMDFLVKTNQTGSEDFVKLWDKATELMQERAIGSYNLIQEQIANLRNTPDIVINVVYKRTEQKEIDRQIEKYKNTYIEPEGAGLMTADRYFREREENVRKYGTYIKKEEEDNVEWEKRLGEEYQNNSKNIESLNKQLANSAKLSDIDKNAKQNELNTLISQNKVLKEIADNQGFDYEQFAKGGKGGGSKKDVLGDALTKEVQLITDIQKRFKEYKQIGVDAQTAIAKATEEYGNTIIKNNATLRKYGVQTLSSEELAALPLQKVREFYQEQIKVANALNNTKGVEALEKALANINVEITKIDYKKITDGLNNELGKLKDEYELAVELDANPEMGDMFLDMFDIDPNALPQTIDQYAERVLSALNKSFEQRKIDFRLPTLDLTRDDIETYRNQVVDGVLDQSTFDAIEKNYKEIQELRKKDAKETLKKTQELQYKLADVDEKIAIETEKLERLRQKLAEETHEEKRKLLELEIKEQEQVIAKLQEDILQMLPTYKALFGGIAEHSAAMTRKIALELRRMLETATLNSDGSYTVTDPQGGTARISRRTREAQLDKVNKEILKTQSSFQKIKESLTKDEDKMVDWAHALELVGDEAKKAADGLKTIGEIFAALGAGDDTVEAINDVANTLEGLSQAGQGVAQIYSGDFIGGTVNVIKGTWNAVSTWLDNSDKKITRNIESSKRAVNRLQNTYEELEYAVEKSMGAAEIGARRAAIENKKLQLAELERQLQLEKSRKKKKQDEDAIIELEGEVASAKRELKDLTDGVVEMLTGSDIKGAAEAFIDAWVQAWRAGENTLDAMNEKMDEMIQNLVKKGVINEIIGTLLDPLYSEIKKFSDEGSEGGHFLTTNELRKIAQDAGVTAEEINIALSEFYGNLERLGILPKTLEANKQLSALQQGIQGITEDTAGALEAYMNNVSQQMYLHTDILTQIRDVVVGFNFDAQLGTISQILLQLQYSYQTQMAIHGILEGVLTPSGRAFTVELAS